MEVRKVGKQFMKVKRLKHLEANKLLRIYEMWNVGNPEVDKNYAKLHFLVFCLEFGFRS